MTHIQQWATSSENRPIELYHSDDFEWTEIARPILFIGGVHGDEPEGVALAEGLLAWLKQSEHQYPSPVKVPWLLIPCLNPDGYLKNERTNGNGVDLNRNFPSKDWIPEHDKPRYNPGRQAGSEPEVQAVTKLIHLLKPRLIVHFHSWKPCVVCSGEPGIVDAQYLAQSSGYEVVSNIGYPTPGSLSQYAWTDLGIPVICIEEMEHIELDSVWPRFRQGLENILGDEGSRT